MSETTQGPGWWQASDGKWYSPESNPSYQPPTNQPPAPTAPQPPAGPPPAAAAPPPQGQPMAPPPVMGPPPQMGAPPGAAGYTGAPGYGPPPATKKSNKGCIIAVVVVLVLFVGFLVAAALGARWVGNQVDSGNAFGKPVCDAISVQDVDATLGGKNEAFQLGGITNIAAPALDSRVLAEGKTCWINGASNADGGGRSVRVATLSGGDAANRFQTEKTKAQGTTENRGNGLTVESLGYFNKDVSGVGDEAFCTTSDIAGFSGVLVRRGNELIYVSMNGGTSFTPGSLTSTPGSGGIPKLGNDDANCDLAQKLAAKVK